MKQKTQRWIAILTIIAIGITCFAGTSIYAAGGIVSDIQNWTNIGTFEETDEGYELSNGGDAFAISDKKAFAFSLQADITILTGDRATLAYGYSNQSDPGRTWRGVEVCKTGDTTGQVKLFVFDSPNLIEPVALTNMDWSEPFTCKVVMEESKKVTIYVNGEEKGSAVDSDYVGGYVGLLSWNTKALFNQIKYSGSMPAGNVVSDVTNWTSVYGCMGNTNEGYVLNFSPKGDNFAISDKNVTAFTFETDVKVISGHGQRATLAYGLGSANNPGGPWRGAEFVKVSDTQMTMRVFNAAGGNVIEPVNLDIAWTEFRTFKLTMDDDKKVTVYIDGQEVASGTDSGYTGGYLGLLTWHTQAVFNNIELSYMAVSGNFITSLPDLRPLGGSWREVEEGLFSSGGGDNFALSSEKGTNFAYEADVSFQEHKGAASLIFLSSDNPSADSYFANIDLGGNNARIYKFGGDTVGEYSLPEDLRAENDFHLRVEVLGKQCKYYLNGNLIISCELENKQEDTSGYFGLLTFDSTVIYQNVKHTVLTEDEDEGEEEGSGNEGSGEADEDQPEQGNPSEPTPETGDANMLWGMFFILLAVAGAVSLNLKKKYCK